jgi:TonB family protein
MTGSFRRVFHGTAIVHCVVLALLFAVQWLVMRPQPLKPIDDIQFIDLAAGGGGDAGPETPPETKAPPEVKPPEEVTPPPEPPKDDTIPEPVKPKPTKIKPKTKPPVKTATPPKTNQVARVKSTKPRLSQDQIRALLSSSVKSVGSRAGSSSGARGGGPGGSGGSDSPVAWYYAMVRQIMYEAWVQPSGLANAGNPTVTVTIRVQRDGTISTWDITRPSGNVLMDESVKRAVQSVRRLRPLPPQFIGGTRDITIQFELEKLML